MIEIDLVVRIDDTVTLRRSGAVQAVPPAGAEVATHADSSRAWSSWPASKLRWRLDGVIDVELVPMLGSRPEPGQAAELVEFLLADGRHEHWDRWRQVDPAS